MSTAERMTLYAIADELVYLDNVLMEADGVLTPEVESRLDALEGAFSSKVEKICELLKSHEHAAVAARSEADRLTKLARVRENAVTSLKSYLQREMEHTGKTRCETDRFVVTLAKSPPSVEWDGLDADIPQGYRRVKIELDSRRVLEDYKAGAELPDGIRVEVRQHVRIR